MKKSKFSQDKEALLKTLSRFDSNITDDNSSDLCENKNVNNHTFFIQVLLEALCDAIEPNEEKQQHLFNGLYNHLVQSQFMNQKLVLDDLSTTRKQLAMKFTELVAQIHSKIVPSPKVDKLPPLPENKILSMHQKYENTFDELEVIAHGGFGTVCKARHKFDEVIYAVKKIVFKYRSDADYLQVIREVKSIATLSHLNIVSYNNAWMEQMHSGDGRASESSSLSTDKYTNNSSISYRSSKRNISEKSQFSSLNHHKSKSSYRKRKSVQSSQLHQSLFSSSSASSYNRILNGSFSARNFYSNSTNGKSDISNEAFSSFNHSRISSIDMVESLKESRDCLISNSIWGLKDMNLDVMLCIQMEFCNCDLRLWLNKRAHGEVLPFQMDVSSIFKDILNGVEYIHSKSIIHRDLKPQNIFFSTKDFVMKIGDFGLSTLEQCSTSHDGFISSHYSSNLGTVPYAAPEQRNNHTYDTKVDIYSLGIILIELLLIFQTQMEFCKTIDDILKGTIPKELEIKYPQYVNILLNLVQQNPKLRLPAKKILKQPPFIDNHEGELLEEIKNLKKSLTEKNELINLLKSEHQEQIKKLEAKIKEQDGFISRLMDDLIENSLA